MPRNFADRFEVMTPIDDPALSAALLGIVEAGLADTEKGSVLGPDGAYTRLRPPAGAGAFGSQDALGAHPRGAPELHAVTPTK